MEFCIGICAKIDAVGLVKQAEDVGASHFGVGEGPLLFSDPYQYLALASPGDQHDQARDVGDQPADPDRRRSPRTRSPPSTRSPRAGRSSASAPRTTPCARWATGRRTMRELDSALTVIRGLLAGRAGHADVARPGPGDRVPGPQRPLVQHRRPGRHLDVRRRPEGLRAGRQARRLHDLLPRAEPGDDRRRPPRAGQGRRRRRPPAGLGQAGRAVPGSTSCAPARPGRTGSTTASAPARSAPASPTPGS